MRKLFYLFSLWVILCIFLFRGVERVQGSFGVGQSCKSQNELPDKSCTPGDVLPVTEKEVCAAGYSKMVRLVSQATKQVVKARYGAQGWCRGRECEVDHLISLELGGSNDPKNLWPEPAPSFHTKDALENYLHAKMCRGEITLLEAQEAISKDWKAEAEKDGLMEGNQ